MPWLEKIKDLSAATFRAVYNFGDDAFDRLPDYERTAKADNIRGGARRNAENGVKPMGGFVKALLGGLSGPQVLIAKGIFGLGAILSVYFAVTSYGKGKFESGAESRQEYIDELEFTYATTKTKLLGVEAELEDCQRIKDEQASRITALNDQNADAAKTAAQVLLETQRINADALIAASRNNSRNTDFNAMLDKKLKGLKNDCDANGNGVVIGGADVLRDVQRGKKG